MRADDFLVDIQRIITEYPIIPPGDRAIVLGGQFGLLVAEHEQEENGSEKWVNIHFAFFSRGLKTNNMQIRGAHRPSETLSCSFFILNDVRSIGQWTINVGFSMHVSAVQSCAASI